MAIKIVKREDNQYIIENNQNGGICYDFACLTEEELESLHTKIGKIIFKGRKDIKIIKK